MCWFSFNLLHASYGASRISVAIQDAAEPPSEPAFGSFGIVVPSVSVLLMAKCLTAQNNTKQQQQHIIIMPYLPRDNREDFWIIHYSG